MMLCRTAQPDVVAWLMEPANPAARYGAMVDLLDYPTDDPEVQAAQQAILDMPSVSRILDAQWPDGYWMHPGVGYSPKHKATVWQIIFLAQIGLPRCVAIERAIEYVLAHSRLSGGHVPTTDVPEARFTAHRDQKGAVLCLNGNLLRSLAWFGYGYDDRLGATRSALAAQIRRDRFACRYNGRTPSGRRPARMADGLPCAWGAVKALSGLLAMPADRRTAAEEEAIAMGCRFLVAHDPATADYPAADEPSPRWFQLGFPLGYAADLLELVSVLVTAGEGRAPGLRPVIDWLLAKQDALGRWALEWTPQNTWASFGRCGQPSKWVTLRALRQLRALSAL